MSVMPGLSESEVLACRQRGEGNDVEFGTSRPYSDIIRHNVLNFFNIILFSVGAFLVLLGRPSDAVFSTIIVILNIIIGTIQEIRAKRKLDEIALLTRPKVTVLREGQEKSVDPAELVKGDILVIRPGDQMVVDGEIVGAGHVDVLCTDKIGTVTSDISSRNHHESLVPNLVRPHHFSQNLGMI